MNTRLCFLVKKIAASFLSFINPFISRTVISKIENEGAETRNETYLFLSNLWIRLKVLVSPLRLFVLANTVI